VSALRVDNWPLVLSQKIEEWRDRPLEYGRTDCFQFAGDVVLALTGIDYRRSFPVYASRAEAAAILAANDGVIGLVTGVLGPQKPVAWAMRGDLIAADFGDALAVGVCLGVHCCAPGPRGLVFIMTARAVAAWSV